MRRALGAAVIALGAVAACYNPGADYKSCFDHGWCATPADGGHGGDAGDAGPGSDAGPGADAGLDGGSGDAGGAITNTTPPSISPASGFHVGDTLLADPGVWSPPQTSFDYTWQRCSNSGSVRCVDIGPASAGNTYVVDFADIDDQIRVLVVPQPAGAPPATSAPVGPASYLSPPKVDYFAGFEEGTPDAEVGAKWSNAGEAAGGSGRNGEGLYLDLSAAGSATLSFQLPPGAKGFTASFAFKSLSASSQKIPITSGSLPTCGAFGLMLDGANAVLDAAGSEPTTTAPAATGTWHTADLSVKLENGTQLVVDGRLDGLPMAEASVGCGDPSVTSFALGGASAVSMSLAYDDLAIAWDATRYPLGDHTVLAMPISGAGQHSTGGAFYYTSGASTVLVPPNGDTVTPPLLQDWPPNSQTWVSQTQPSTVDYLEYLLGPPASPPPTPIAAVKLALAGHLSSNGAYDPLVLVTNDPASTKPPVAPATLITGAALGFGYAWFATSPETGVAWTGADLTSLRLRWGYASSTAQPPSLDAALVEVAFMAH